MRLALFASCLSLAACIDTNRDPREDEIVGVVARADFSLIATRPRLVAGKYDRMAATPVDFYRGGIALFRHDTTSGATAIAASRFSLATPLVPSLGDPHPENFGALRASDGTLALEPNDLDAADRAPFLWDVRRLVAGLVAFAAASNSGDTAANERARNAARSIARRAAEAYVDGLDRAIAQTGNGRVTDATTNPLVADLFERSERDHAARAELAELTLVGKGGGRTLKRGVIDPEEPEHAFVELPEHARDALDATLRHYRETLVVPYDPSYFTIRDAVRELGSGVASWPRIRALVLVRGPTDAVDDDVILEVKELGESGIAGFGSPGVSSDDVASRVRDATRGAWGRLDAAPLWGTGEWVGLPVQIRQETEGQKGLRVERMVDERGTVEALTALATTLGGIVARVHAGDREAARAVRARIGDDRGEFAAEQAEFAIDYGANVRDDAARFARALRRLGPRLGVPFDPNDEAQGDVAALLASPARRDAR